MDAKAQIIAEYAKKLRKTGVSAYGLNTFEG